jgi:uncharacterized membrane protein YhaH (DUF805 family)
METLGILLKDSRFWAAVLVLVNATLFYFLPNFPMAIWTAFDALIAVMLVVLASNGAVQTKRARAAQRAADADA